MYALNFLYLGLFLERINFCVRFPFELSIDSSEEKSLVMKREPDNEVVMLTWETDLHEAEVCEEHPPHAAMRHPQLYSSLPVKKSCCCSCF